MPTNGDGCKGRTKGDQIETQRLTFFGSRDCARASAEICKVRSEKQGEGLHMRIPRYLPAPAKLFVRFFLAALRPE